MKRGVGIAAAPFFWAALCFPNHSFSQTIYAFGVGTDSCGAYTSHIVAPPGKSISRTAPDDKKDYYSKSTTYLEWLLGFITGYNAAVSDPDKQMQLDIAAVDLHVRNWCAQNPTSNIFTAVHQLLDKNNPKQNRESNPSRPGPWLSGSGCRVRTGFCACRIDRQ